MKAGVVIKVFILRLKAENVILSIAPPVPNNPVAIPEKLPPQIEFDKVRFRARVLKIRKTKLAIISNKAS